MNVPNTKIALQLYTIREALNTPEDVAASLKQIRDIGYEAVELASITCMSNTELKRLFDQVGVYCCSMHVGVADLTNELEATLAKMRILECPHAALAWCGPEYRNAEGVKQLAQILNTASQKFKTRGLTLSYHNHKFEFEKMPDKLMLTHLYELTNPQVLSAQLDLCWVQMGAANPVVWIRNLRARIWSLHYKDITVKNDAYVQVPVGDGNLDWPEIVRASAETTARFYIVEQDTCEGDPFAAVQRSYQYLQQFGI